MQKEYAAKFVKCRPREKQAMYSEIKIMNELNHKRLVQLYDAYETPKNIVLVLELVTGGELFEKLTELEYISEHVVVYYMKQVLQGLSYMHERQILHLDLKVSLIVLILQCQSWMHYLKYLIECMILPRSQRLTSIETVSAVNQCPVRTNLNTSQCIVCRIVQTSVLLDCNVIFLMA